MISLINLSLKFEWKAEIFYLTRLLASVGFAFPQFKLDVYSFSIVNLFYCVKNRKLFQINCNYIHNCHYKLLVRIIDLVSHTTYIVRVNFVHKWRDLQFKVDSERQIFWETFHGNLIQNQSFCQKSAESKSQKKYFLYFVLMPGLGLESWLLNTKPRRLQ